VAVTRNCSVPAAASRHEEAEKRSDFKSLIDLKFLKGF
jgi:hypothetical protein